MDYYRITGLFKIVPVNACYTAENPIQILTNKMEHIKLILISGLIILFSSCVEEQNNENKFGEFSLIPTEYSIEIPDSFSENFIGGIRDMTTDLGGNLYLVDHQSMDVKKFDREGEMTNVFGLGKGSGPGEFENPISVAVDSSGNVYVADMSSNRINIFNSENEAINQFTADFAPARIIVDGDKSIYLMGFPMFYEGDLIQKYELNDENRYQKTISFGKRPEGVDNRLLARAGNVDLLTLDTNGNVYHSLWYPYEIRKYTSNGELLNSYTREVSFFKDPESDSNGIVRFTSGSWGLMHLDGDTVINQIFKIDENSEWTFYYDVIDLNLGEHIGQISEVETDLPINGRVTTIDKERNIYIGRNSPEVDVFKYSVQSFVE